MAKLASAVFVKDPDRNATVLLLPGHEPEPRLAALVTSPEAWEDGKPPAVADKPTDSSKASKTEDDDDGDKPAAKRAARKPARGRNAADEGSSGD
jgi:hypothetical protein